MKEKIIEKIKSVYSDYNEGLEADAVQCVIELIEDYDINIEDYETTQEFVEALDDEGYINEAVESYVPIYNADLYEWSKDNGHHITDAMGEYGSRGSFENLISQGYHYHLEEVVREIFSHDWIENLEEENE